MTNVPDKYAFDLAPVAVNGLTLPYELTKELSAKRWTGLSHRFGTMVGDRFGVKARHPKLFDYVLIVRATGYLMSDSASGMCGLGVALSQDLDPQKCVAIGDLVGDGVELLVLDYRTEPPCVRVMTRNRWAEVAVSLSDFLEQINLDD